MDKALDDMRDAIHSSIDNMILTLNAQIRSIQKQNEQSNEQIAANPDQAKYLLSVERQQKIKETLYLFLLQKREENALSQAFTAYNTRVITPPYGSLAPTSPKRFNIMVIVFVIGLFIPMIVLFLQENMNTVVRGRKDIEKMTIPFAGEIPLSDKKRKLGSRKQPEVIVSVEAGKRNVINEAFRVLRTNIEFMNKGNDSSKVLLFTSYNQGSGKTYLSMNLAISFALKGKKVLVIDGDLRHASLSKYVKSPKVGLTNYLAQQVDSLDEIIVPFEGQENLYLIPVGLNPPNPTELIGDARFGQMMETLRERYDYIIVDCPPIDIVADTQIIEKYTDRTLFVVRAGLMERGMLDDLDRIYEEQRFKNMALVLNGSSENNGRYGYRYGYKYGYYHSYSYYN
jgi:capsular exopolysaccharide synthesis family protein